MSTEILQKALKLSKDELQEIVSELSKKHGGRAACILDLIDKRVLASKIPSDISEEEFLRVAFGFGSILSKYTSGLGIGKFSEAIIKGSDGWLVIIHNDGLAVVGVFSNAVNAALAETATKNSTMKLWKKLQQVT
ncbi:MAG: hypothetical protein ACP6IS_04265 [Candidatus Asgardarchaeia archaeon]